ncbi:uncharacterized protein LOC125668816 [Ostrea edulis]|uniref:uncharacterized protein LOC125668816 n=1 Tax=Ostrea edulis TaxID=37623 RepID=UPI0020952CFF|nr:uncharacterized protein LOC125668816 [Ostrea edulis]
MPFLTQFLLRRPSPFVKQGQLPRAPKARFAGVPVLKNSIANKDYTGFEGNCNEQMQNMLSCLTNAALNQSACEEEILSYNTCMKKAIEVGRMKKANKFVANPTTSFDGRQKVPPPIINKVMSRYPMKYKSLKNIK